MNKLKFALIFIAIALKGFSGFAQDVLPNTMMGTPSYLDTVTKYYNQENQYPFDLGISNLNAKIPVRVHIVRDKTGALGLKTSDLEMGLNNANTFFAEIGIHFYIDSVNIVNDYNYGYIRHNHYKKELLALYAAQNKVNLFIVDSIKMGNAKGFGFTYFPIDVDSNYIFLDKKYVSGKYLTTMLGHFMGLLPTHETGKGVELASEKNCSNAGDFICDTYADPNLQNVVDSTCTYTGGARDGEGKYFVPTVANIMSNAPDGCKCKFTPQQYRRMYFYFLKFRQKLGN